MRIVAALLLALAGPSFLGLATTSPEAGQKDGERLKHLIPKGVKQVQSLPALSAQPTARLIARAGVTTAQLESIRQYQVEMTGEMKPTRVAFIDVDWGGKPARIGVGATPTGGLIGPLAFDEYGKAIDDFEPMLQQFRGHGGVTLTEASLAPIGDTLKRRDDAIAATRPPPKPAERKAWTMFHHLKLMRRAGQLHEQLQAAREAGEPMRSHLRELSDHFDEVDRFATNLKVVAQPKEIGEYRKFIDELQGHAENALRLVDEGSAEEAEKIVKAKVKTSCGKCHGWDGNHWRKPFEGVMRAEREASGWGNGSFVIGVDLAARGFEESDAQQVACAVKAGMLMAFGKE